MPYIPFTIAPAHFVPLAVQLDSFSKASTRSGRRLSRLFSGRKSPKTPSPGGSTTPGSTATPPPMTLDDMMLYQTVRLALNCMITPLVQIQSEDLLLDDRLMAMSAAHQMPLCAKPLGPSALLESISNDMVERLPNDMHSGQMRDF